MICTHYNICLVKSSRTNHLVHIWIVQCNNVCLYPIDFQIPCISEPRLYAYVSSHVWAPAHFPALSFLCSLIHSFMRQLSIKLIVTVYRMQTNTNYFAIPRTSPTSGVEQKKKTKHLPLVDLCSILKSSVLINHLRNSSRQSECLCWEFVNGV